MRDRITAWMAIAFFAAALVLPLLALGAGLVSWNWRTASLQWSGRYRLWVGLVGAVGTFGACFALGVVVALQIESPVWIEVLIPFVSSIGYSVFNIIPLPIDDVVVSIGAAVVSYLLALKRYEGLTRWVLAPTVVAAVYTAVGEFVPGPVDELAAGAGAAILSSVVARVASRRASQKTNPERKAQ
jgi:hypothetical protein